MNGRVVQCNKNVFTYFYKQTEEALADSPFFWSVNRSLTFAPCCVGAIIVESAYYRIMSKEQQPPDRSDAPPLSPKELMRQTVFMLANREDITPADVGNWNIDEDATKWGFLRFGPLGPAKFMVAQIRDPRLVISEPLLYRSSNLLTLTVYDSSDKGSSESVMMSDDVAGVVIADVGDREINDLTPTAEDEYIRDFFERHHINERLKRLGLTPSDS